MRIAIVHEWLEVVAGSEHVLEQMLLLFPDADLFVMVDFLKGDDRKICHGRRPETSFIQHLPFAKSRFRKYLPLMPLAVEQLDVSGYDLVISNSHAFAKGVLTSSEQVHICYCHTPLRYAWDMQHAYLRESDLVSGPASWIIRASLHYLRLWDYRTAHGVDKFLANSDVVARRIGKIYSQDATVIHPPVDTDYFQPSSQPREDWYVTASRLTPYKRTDVIVDAFTSMPDKQLLVIGDGPQMEKCKARADSNVTFLGHVSRDRLRDALQRARAFIFAAEEDFGIAPVEAQACGTPVIGYGKGGLCETVIPGVTGTFFLQQTAASLCKAVTQFENTTFNDAAIRANAERFSVKQFRDRFRAFVYEATGLREETQTHRPARIVA